MSIAAPTPPAPRPAAPAARAEGDASPEAVLHRQSARESAARTYARSLPVVPVRAHGMTVEGADGRRYLDCLAGAGTLALGHNHPVVVEAVRRALDSGAPLHALDLATPLKDTFTTELFACLPEAFVRRGVRVQFCGPAGTDAVEAAIKLVRTATGRPGLLAFTGGYHGMTAGALAASGESGAARVGGAGAADAVVRLPYPYDYRCPFGVGGEEGARLAARWTRALLDDPRGGVPPVAGMLLEPVQGEGGVIPAPDAWLRAMRAITEARGIPLIADEVQTGVGRTGAFWGVQHSGVVPDVMVVSKAVGGSLPLAAVVYREDLDRWSPGAHAGTFRGDQLAMAAGAATLRFVRENALHLRAAEAGERMLRGLRALADRHGCVGQARGRGLMLGLEIVEPAGGTEPAADRPADPAAAAPAAEAAGLEAWLRGPDAGARRPDPPAAAPGLARAVQQAALRRGLMLELGGRHGSVVRLLPPLTMTDAEAEAVLERLDDALDAAEHAHEHTAPAEWSGSDARGGHGEWAGGAE